MNTPRKKKEAPASLRNMYCFDDRYVKEGMGAHYSEVLRKLEMDTCL